MRSRELAPVLDPERLQSLRPHFGYKAMCLWFSQLPPRPNMDSRVKELRLGGHTDAKVSLRASYDISGGMRTASLMFYNATSPLHSIILRGRMEYVRSAPPTYEELDLLGDNELAWRTNSSSELDLIPKDTTVGAVYEPILAKVRSADTLTPQIAESRLLETLQMIDESTHDKI